MIQEIPFTPCFPGVDRCLLQIFSLQLTILDRNLKEDPEKDKPAYSKQIVHP